MSRSPFLSLLGRHRLLTGVCVLVGALGGAALYVALPETYTATAQVLVTPTGVQDQPNNLGPRQRENLNLDTEAQIAQSAVVAGLAAEKLGVRDIDEVRRNITVNVPPNSAILAISYTAGTPNAAAAGAQAVATAYLANREAAATRTLAVQQRLVAAAIREADKELTEVTASLATLAKGTAEYLNASRRQTILGRQVATLTAKADALRTVAVTPGTVISPARPPDAPTGPGMPLYLGSGLFLGLLAGSGAAVFRESRPARMAHAHAW